MSMVRAVINTERQYRFQQVGHMKALLPASGAFLREQIVYKGEDCTTDQRIDCAVE